MAQRFGIAELYGQAIEDEPLEKLRSLASSDHRQMPCPFKGSREGEHGRCHKKGGVCSIQLYLSGSDEGSGVLAGESPVTLCPARFQEGNKIYHWVGEKLLGTQNPEIISELSFLMAEKAGDSNKGRSAKMSEVGKIDNVLVNPNGRSLDWWCPLEIQAVYFSGANMEKDLKLLRAWDRSELPFPQGNRRPDFRSSGPKRLMPQLQIKVPTIRRWGKKMAVVVDRPFWDALGTMQEVPDVSRADIVWFVVGYRKRATGSYSLELDAIHPTTLEWAVEGLTGGTPVSLEQFERQIQQKLARR